MLRQHKAISLHPGKNFVPGPTSGAFQTIALTKLDINILNQKGNLQPGTIVAAKRGPAICVG
jgi:hypothetical protein